MNGPEQARETNYTEAKKVERDSDVLQRKTEREPDVVNEQVSEGVVALCDEDTGVVAGLRLAILENPFLQSPLEVVCRRKLEGIFKLLLGVIKYSHAGEHHEEDATLENALVSFTVSMRILRVALRIAHHEMHSLQLSIVFEAQLADHLELVVHPLFLVRPPWLLESAAEVAIGHSR